MLALFKRFRRDEAGVVTADWTALTGGMVLLGLAVLYAVMRSAVPLVDATTDTMSSMQIGAPVGQEPDFK